MDRADDGPPNDPVGDDWQDAEDLPSDWMACPDCEAEVHADADACPVCGYWITDEDRDAAWRSGSASGQIITLGLWALGLAAVALLWSLFA